MYSSPYLFFQRKDETRFCEELTQNIEFYASLMLMLFLPLIECFFLMQNFIRIALHKEYTYMLKKKTVILFKNFILLLSMIMNSFLYNARLFNNNIRYFDISRKFNQRNFFFVFKSQLINQIN